HGFLRRSLKQLDELAALLTDGEDEREHVQRALEDMADTAASLGLDQVRDAARMGVLEVELGSGPALLGAIAHVLRIGDAVPLFPPIGLVTGGHREVLGRLQGGFSETMHVVESVEVLSEKMWFEDMQGAIVPVKPRRALQRLARQAPGKVFAWGPPDDPPKRSTAIRDGAVGYFSIPLVLRSVLGRIRFHTQRRMSDAPRVLLVGGPAWDGLDAALEQVGATVGWASGPRELLTALHEFGAEIVVVGIPLNAGSVSESVGIVRTDEASTFLPIVLVGSELAAGLKVGTVDQCLDPDLDPAEKAALVRARLDRPRGRVAYRDPLTGLLNRPAVLSRLDDEFFRARRSRESLAVVLIDVDGMGRLNQRWDRSVGDLALRRVADVLRQGVRRYDVTGRLGGDAFLVAWPGCTASQACTRVAQLQESLHERCAGHPALKRLTFSAGVADSTRGLEAVVRRADAALSASRVRGIDCTVEVDE
ncbi:MAG: GGDEF domain-containing protein, partial [Deltaproteobacteria bacterium]|nr:GGDEF domain-containing protein [Deltaproteobacteria bacterium]